MDKKGCCDLKFRLAAELLLVCLIPANVCQGMTAKGILDGDTKIEKGTKGNVKIRPKKGKGRLKKTPKGKKSRKGIAKVIKVEIASMPIQVAVVKGRDGIKQEVYESWEKEIPENAAKAARRQPFETF
ncbi:unknown [Roseburia sp. CAG:309]|nr:unknown [Roseburia sp. CAG:309]